MAEKTRSFSEAAAAANLPKRIKMDDLAAMGVVTYVSARGETRNIPDGSGQTEGFETTIEDDKGVQYNVFIGGEVLTYALARVEFPFKARIVKDGRAWVFAD